MSILAKLTVTPLLWACGLLLAALVAAGAYAAVLDVRLGAAQASVTAAKAERDTARTERDAWKLAADAAASANNAYGSAVTVLQAELKRAQGESRRMDEAGQQAIAAARADAADAERALAAMAAQIQTQSRVPACALALSRLEAACPAFSGY